MKAAVKAAATTTTSAGYQQIDHVTMYENHKE